MAEEKAGGPGAQRTQARPEDRDLEVQPEAPLVPSQSHRAIVWSIPYHRPGATQKVPKVDQLTYQLHRRTSTGKCQDEGPSRKQ